VPNQDQDQDCRSLCKVPGANPGACAYAGRDGLDACTGECIWKGPVTETVLNVGPPVTVHMNVDGRPTSPVLNTGDQLGLTGTPDQVASWKADMATYYPDVVLADSARAVAYRNEERERRELAEATTEVARKRAEEWLSEHGVPDYVVEYLRDR